MEASLPLGYKTGIVIMAKGHYDYALGLLGHSGSP